MSQIKRIGIDTSKAVFTLHAVDEAGKAVCRQGGVAGQSPSCPNDPLLP
jgi:hypothetical protein